MQQISPKAREAIELARRGQLARAIALAETAVADAPADGGLRLFIGSLHARRLDFDAAATCFATAAELMSGHLLPQVELIRVLIGGGRLDEAEAAIRQARQTAPQAAELWRLEGLLFHRRGDHAAAAARHREATARDPADFESWGNLGLSLLALRRPHDAAAALNRALALRPDQHRLRLKLAEALVASGEAETALADIRAAADTRSDPRAWLLAGRVEDLLDRPAEAEAALRRALAIAPNLVPALLALADLLERDNRIDAFAETLATLDSVGVPRAETALLHARLLLRRGELDRALEMARAAPDSLDPGTKAKLIGEICDRMGDVDTAFTAFTEMNRLTAREQAGADRMAASYRVRVAALGQMTTEQWYGGWSAARPAANRAAPAFLFGFPRSGTTLLDTMLMGHPDSVVMEETPVLETLSESFGDQSGLPPLDQPAIEALRRDYFRIADSHAPEAAGAGLLVDKVPLGLTLTPLVHRIFPDARFIFVERHPADVVLSCYMTRFSPRDGTANFLGLEDTAELYDLIMDYWRHCRAVLPLAVHTVRYESMIDDAEGELRALAAFLELAWDPALLDHRRSASKRAYIATPSYAQVSEPLYTRARGRWKRYRRQLEPVLPILAPWATEMGYDI